MQSNSSIPILSPKWKFKLKFIWFPICVAWCCFKCCCCWILIPWKCLFSDNVTRSEQRAMAQTQFSSEKRATKTRIYHTFGYCTQHMCLCVVKSMFNHTHTHTNTRDPAAEIVTTFFCSRKDWINRDAYSPKLVQNEKKKRFKEKKINNQAFSSKNDGF